MKRYKGVTLKYKLMLWKAYFEKGWAITSYLKYILALFGLASMNIEATLIIGFFYGISCFFLGAFWWKHKLAEIEYDVQNEINPFCRKMLKKRKV